MKDYVAMVGLPRRQWDLARRLLWEAEEDARAMLFQDLPLAARQEFEMVRREARAARLQIVAQVKGRP